MKDEIQNVQFQQNFVKKPYSIQNKIHFKNNLITKKCFSV
jgi:hypothetical protein